MSNDIRGSRLALYVPTGAFDRVHNPFGKDTANTGLFRALAVHGGFEELGVLTMSSVSQQAVINALCQDQSTPTRIWTSSVLRSSAAARAGAVLRGTVDLADLAWLRNAHDQRSHSLIGLIHTIAPPGIRDQIAACAIAPVQPWDALICTSPAVQTAVERLFDDFNDHLCRRFQGTVRARPQLPLIPLGVDAAALEQQAERPDIGRTTRETLKISEGDVVVLWVGRLSFFEKAFPQPMFRAVEEAQAISDRRIHFVMVGWFPDGKTGFDRYSEAARAYAPNVPVHFIDGNDPVRVGACWAAADIFLSLVDNIQETFGLTPLEAMAAGLPVVASDWDGYRFTIRHGIEGFLIPTLGGPSGSGGLMSVRHIIGFDSYQHYVGTVAQHTAVDPGKAAEALAALVSSPDLRRRMGAAGRERVRTCFDWPIIARQVRNLVDDLAALRAGSAPFGQPRSSANPAKGDPFTDFQGYATTTLDDNTELFVRKRSDIETIEGDQFGPQSVQLDSFGAAWRLPVSETQSIIRRLAAGPLAVRDLLAPINLDQHQQTRLTLVWLCKLGILGWNSRTPRSDL